MKSWLAFSLPSFAKGLKLPLRIGGINLGVAAGLAARLSSRERWFVGLAGGVVVILLLSLFVMEPLRDMHGRLQAKVVAKERELTDVAALANIYEQLRRELEEVGSVNSTTRSPFAFLEGLAMSTLGREKLAAINPVGHEERGGVTQETIELKLTGVSLQELVDLLYKIDVTGTALRCTNLAIKKRYKDPYTFDVTLTAIALNTRS